MVKPRSIKIDTMVEVKEVRQLTIRTLAEAPEADAPVVTCGQCGHPNVLEADDVVSMAGRINNRKIGVRRGKQPTPTQCRWCDEVLDSVGLATIHERDCPKRPETPARKHRAKVMRECPHCHGSFGTVELATHKPACYREQQERERLAALVT